MAAVGQYVSATLDLCVAVSASPERCWMPSVAKCSEFSLSQAVEQVRELFLSNICLLLRSDVPLGTVLSGGIDSSAVACGMRHVELDLPIHTFSYIAQDSALSEEA